MRPAVSGRHSPAMHKIYVRRRIAAGVAVAVVILLIIFLLTRIGGGGKSHVSTGNKGTSTTRGLATTTTTLPMRPVAMLASWHLPLALSREVALPINNQIGIFGGLSTSGINDRIYEIDTTNGQATSLGSMPTAVRDAAGAVIGSSYYVFGGMTRSAATTDVQQFTFANSTTMTGSVVGSLPAKRSEMESASANGRVLLVGGFDGSSYLTSVVSSTDGMNFTVAAQLSPAVRYAAVAVLNETMYVIGGEIGPNAADATAVQAINLTSGTVTQLTPLPQGLSHAVAVTLNNTIYVLGGRSGGHAITTINQFQPSSGALEPMGSLPVATSDMGVVVIGQGAYLLGGENDSGTPSTDVIAVTLTSAPAPATLPTTSSTRATTATTQRTTPPSTTRSTTPATTPTTAKATTTSTRATTTTTQASGTTSST